MDYTSSKFWFSSEGRLNRQPYFFATLLSGGIVHVLANNTPQEYALMALPVILFFAFISIVLGIKRCHDRDRTGWFLLLNLIPILNLWPLIELTFIKGTDGPNRFGNDPLKPAPPPPSAATSQFQMQ